VYLVVAGLTLLLVIAALIDIITRDDSQVKHLPKLVWILLVILLPFVGSLVWFVVGHDWSTQREAMSFGDPRRSEGAPPRPRYEPVVDDATIEAEMRLAEKEARMRRLEAELEKRRRTQDGPTEAP
jgi:hypothetical protein